MMRLLKIEFHKLRNTKYFWILASLFVMFMLAIPIASNFFLDYITEQGAEFAGISANQIPLYDFVDIWQNLTFVYKMFSIFLGFIVVISICNEYSYTTVRQNVIDGMSRREFLLSKIYMIVAISVVVSIAALLIGLLMGYLWSPVTDFDFVVRNIEFVGAYFIHLITFLMFCLAVSMLIKRAGIAIAIMVFYIYMIEPIAVAITKHGLEWDFVSGLFPVAAAGNIIQNPFPKYVLMQVQDYIGLQDAVICLGYLGLFVWLSNFLIVKRDV